MTAPYGPSDNRVPATVVTGYLGAGKTTLINHMIASAAGRKLAIIVNEFGDIGIDGDLIQSGDEELIELSSGCVCCVVRVDLIRTLRRLLQEKPGLDGIVIETTGLANPGPVIQTFMSDQVISAQCRLDSVVAVVDAAHIFRQIGDSRDAADQVAFSDYIVLNKVGVASTRIIEIERQIARLNPLADIFRTDHAAVPADSMFNRRSFALEPIRSRLPAAQSHDHDHTHTDGIGSVSLHMNHPVDANQFEDWLQTLLDRQGSEILRTKGVLWVAGEPQKLVVQSVNMMLEGHYAGAWQDAAPDSRMVLIGRNLDPVSLEAGFTGCRAPEPA